MKPLMLFAIIMLVSIVVVVSFGLQLSPNAPIALSPESAANALYICPTTSPFWDGFAQALIPFHRYLVIGLFFVVMLLMFSWGWALYQNLLSDSFKRDSFKNPWQMTKFTFWVSVIVLLFVMTPNYYRTVKVDGLSGEYVLCESDSPGARAVRADAVHG